MKLTFTFTDSPNLKSLSRDDIYQSHLELPDTVLQLPDAREQVLDLAVVVSKLTDAVLHVSCKDLGLKDHPIKLVKGERPDRIQHSWRNLIIRFDRLRYRGRCRDLKIRWPVINDDARIPPYWGGGFVPASYLGGDEPTKQYIALISQVADNCISLFNAEPGLPSERAWSYVGFDPAHKDGAAIDRFNKRSKKREAEAKRQARLEQKWREREAKISQPGSEQQTAKEPPITGAGRRVGAVPGVFKGVQFRSQLEIRFVTQLAARQIRWVYEGERLGEGNYLVDFYLPDLRCWVEVKGRVEPRDDYLLKDVAAYLKRERDERLFVYTQGKAYAITSERFNSLTHDQFWSRLEGAR